MITSSAYFCSIGTTVAVRYADACGISCQHVLFTPLEETFSVPVRDAIAFHGTADPWADDKEIEEWILGEYPDQESLWESAEKMIRDFSWDRTAGVFLEKVERSVHKTEREKDGS